MASCLAPCVCLSTVVWSAFRVPYCDHSESIDCIGTVGPGLRHSLTVLSVCSASRYDALLAEGTPQSVLDERRLVRVHPQFRVIAIGLPCPPFAGNALDPPLRSRFQARYGFHTAGYLSFGPIKECYLFCDSVREKALRAASQAFERMHNPLSPRSKLRYPVVPSSFLPGSFALVSRFYTHCFYVLLLCLRACAAFTTCICISACVIAQICGG